MQTNCLISLYYYNFSAGLTKVISELMPGARNIDKFGSELKYSLLKINENVYQYGNVFNFLELHKSELGIRSYGIADTSLEEVLIVKLIQRLYKCKCLKNN